MNRKQRLILGAVLFGYLLLGITYSVVSPIFEVSDELWHYPMVETLARNQLSLPVQDPSVQTPWRQEGSQPPLYYLAAAVLTAPIDTSDLSYVRRINPHADIGTMPPDGNANMIVQRPDAQGFPWSGTVLAVQVVRLFSVILGFGTVLVTIMLARELFPDRPTVIIGAASLNAFLPMFLFISGSVNNDNASNLLGNLLTLLTVRLLKRSTLPPIKTYIVLGIITGLGLLAKLNLGFFIPVIAISLTILSVQLKSWRPLIVGGAVSGGLTILIAGWWYWRNFQLYGDPTGLNVFLDIVGRRAIPANAAQLWAERFSFSQAFWGFFGGVNVAMPGWVYTIFDALALVAITGVGVFIVRRLTKRDWHWQQWLPAAVTLIWIGVTSVSYLRWTAETPASQGRLLFGALSSICVWMALGLTSWLPQRVRPIMMTGAAGWYLAVAILAPFLTIQPAYALPEQIEQGIAIAEFTEPEGGGRIGLLNAEIHTPVVVPDSYVEITLDWQIESPVGRDWSLFVHLHSPDGVVIGQRDVYPGSGSLATSDLSVGYAWRNPVAINVPTGAYAPMVLDVIVGWYHLPTGERLSYGADDTFLLGTVQLESRDSVYGVPNPTSKILGGEAELVGYSISDLSPAAGSEVEVTLYWRRLRPITNSYVVFVHVIDPSTLTIYGGSDAQPAGWTAPTNTWEEGVIIEDTHTFTINPATPPGIYELEIGMYTQDESGQFNRLRVITPDGGMANDYAYLSRMRVMPREDEAP